MGPEAGAEIDHWLQAGGLVLAASERAARALQSAFHQRRRVEGLTAWPAPAIHTWAGFVRTQWEARGDSRMLLNPAQERALWSGILEGEPHLATLLAGPRHRLAALAMRAHALLCSYAPRYLKPAARAGWDRDAGAFSDWLTAFDAQCTKVRALSPDRAILDVIAALLDDTPTRPPLLLAGFDRLLPVQSEFLRAWGSWRALATGDAARELRFYGAPDEATELDSCAAWTMRRIEADPSAQLLVLTQDIAQNRGKIERAFLRAAPPGSAPLFEFSLGIPLAEVPLARAAHLMLRWLDRPLLEAELDWLFSTGQLAATPEESNALPGRMRALRRAGLARPEWTLSAFASPQRNVDPLPAAWIQRMQRAQQQLTEAGTRPQSPLDWAALVPKLLNAAGFPGGHLASAEFQAWQRWQQALDTCASLGFDGRRVPWSGFLADLARILSETLFTPESTSAPIQIAGPAESAGLAADAVWFLGGSEDAWPSSSPAHPLLPRPVQRECGMPHATPQLDWELANSVTQRIAASATEVIFSYPRRSTESELRPSRIILQLAGAPQALPAQFAPRAYSAPCTIPFADASRVPFALPTISGGASVLTAQSQCPFKAFATARLGAQAWQPAEFGLSAAQRGQLLHAAFHAVWGGPPRGLRSLPELLALPDREAFAAEQAQRVMRDELPAGVRERMPQRYLALEATRLGRLLNEWLTYEAARIDFTVERVEAPGHAQIGELSLALRLDRIDRLADGSLLVIDYKSGDVTPKAWELPRPDDVQLPLYAAFAIDGEPGGLLFAKVRAGESRFVGLMRDANANLLAGLNARDALAREKLTPEQMQDWRDAIEQLARDFVGGRADVAPRAYPDTCDHCGLQPLCRIHELRASADHDGDTAEDSDE
jgi:probable DNA repair protein